MQGANPAILNQFNWAAKKV